MPKRLRNGHLVLRPRPVGSSLFNWLCDELRRLIADRVLKRGAMLPSTRRLAEAYGLARGTVVQVYEQLQAEGYLDGARGSGTRVSQESPDQTMTLRTLSARRVHDAGVRRLGKPASRSP